MEKTTSLGLVHGASLWTKVANSRVMSFPLARLEPLAHWCEGAKTTLAPTRRGKLLLASRMSCERNGMNDSERPCLTPPLNMMVRHGSMLKKAVDVFFHL